MIKAEVVFNNDDSIIVNGFTVNIVGGIDGNICVSVGKIGFFSLSEAIKYCMEKQQ